VYSVEPEGFDDTARSLQSGKREGAIAGARSICDALLAPEPGELTFPINRRLVDGGFVVSDAEVRAAMRYAFETLKLVTEPGGAVALAALLSGKANGASCTTALTISGANVDAAQFAEILTEQPA
jgi:threonine dehydratase